MHEKIIPFFILFSLINFHEFHRKRFEVNALRKIPIFPEFSNQTTFISGKETKEFYTELITQRRLRSVNPSDPEAHRVTNLPGSDTSLSGNFRQYAGHLSVFEEKDRSDAALFYWLIEPDDRAQSERLPLLVWLNGGPGCSSMDGLWLELGPLRLQAGDKVTLNPHSWHREANLLFIDQPVGTGLSYTNVKDGYAKNDNIISAHFYRFLQNFFHLHSRYVSKDGSSTRAFYLSGESHAGHYIPIMASYILKRNNELAQQKQQQQVSDNNDLSISLQGLALGNPWVDPPNQYDVSDLAHGLGLISVGQRNRLKEQEADCKSLLRKGRLNQRTCFALLDSVIDGTATRTSQRLLMYDARKFSHNTKSYPPGHEDVERYLNRPDVLEALHVKGLPHKYEECADPPYNALSHQDGKGATTELASVLDAGIRVLIYSGQFDLVCNHIGTEKMLDSLAWSGQTGFQQAPSGVWEFGRKTTGFCRSYRNLHLLLVLDSGHMVPMDLPEQSLEMIRKFLASEDFSSKPVLALASSTTAPLDCPPRTLQRAQKAVGGMLGATGLPSSRNKAASFKSQSRSRVLFASSSVPQVSVAHALPLETAVALRLRATASSSETLAQLLCVQILLEPGNIAVSVPWNRAGAVPRRERDREALSAHLDLVIDQLLPGHDYSFSVRSCEDSRVQLSRRSVSVRPGCYSPLRSQCCGRGECVAISANSSSCLCDAGFSGTHCDFYQVSLSGNQRSNVSAGALCASSRPFYSNLTFRLQGGSLVPSEGGELRTNAHPLFIPRNAGLFGQLKYCSNSTAASACALTLELLVEPQSSAQWLCRGRSQGTGVSAYDNIIIPAVRLDIQHAMEAALNSTMSSPGTVRASVSMGSSRHSASSHKKNSVGDRGGEVKLGGGQICSFPLLVKLDGPSSQVDYVASHLLQQLVDHTSPLRSGAVTQHLRPQLVRATAGHGQPQQLRLAGNPDLIDNSNNRRMDGKDDSSGLVQGSGLGRSLPAFIIIQLLLGFILISFWHKCKR